MKITKEELLELTNNGLDFFQFVLPDLITNTSNSFKNTYNPFYHDSVPSLSIYRNDDEDRWRFKDHGDETYQGDVFDFAACHYELKVEEDFKEIISRIAEDLELQKSSSMAEKSESGSKFEKPDTKNWLEEHMEGLHFESEDDRYAYEQHLIPEPTLHHGFELHYDGDEDGLEKSYLYYNSYGVTKAILKEYNVRAIKAITYENSNVEYDGLESPTYTKRIFEGKLTVAYNCLHFAKIYCPEPKKFWYAGKKDKNFVFGLQQLFSRAHKAPGHLLPNTVIITGGEKDVLTLRSLGYDAICFNSETALAPKSFLDYKKAFNNVIILYDNDPVGQSSSHRLRHYLMDNGFTHVSICELPEIAKEKEAKDISDYVLLNLDIDLIHSAIKTVTSNNIEETKTIEEIYDNDNDGSPLLPEKVYDLLPPFIRHLTNQFTSRRDKDVCLLSCLTAMSTCFPKVQGLYAHDYVGLNLYTFISATAGAGKGEMKWGKQLLQKIKEHINDLNKKREIEYQAALEQNKENKNGEIPERPKPQHFIIPGNSSTSVIYEYLDANQNFGIIIETEADIISANLKSDWADFSSLLRKAFHHEHASMARRANNEHLEIERPHLSMLLSGTRNQINRLVSSVENGLFSRIAFYDFDAKVDWDDKFGIGSDHRLKVFEHAAEKLLKFWKHGENTGRSTFELSEKKRLDTFEYFSKKIKEMHGVYGDEIVASVRRICLIYFRIAMILSAIKMYSKMNSAVVSFPQKIEIGDSEAECALLIVDTLLTHLETVFIRIRETKLSSTLNSDQLKLYNALPSEYEWLEFKEIAKKTGINYNTAQKYSRDFVRLGFIKRTTHGEYIKVK